MIAGLVAMVIAGRDRIRIASSPLDDLLLHTGIFTVVNAFVWAQDYALGDGLNYALWITIPWAVGLIGHAIAYVVHLRRHATIAPFESMLRQEAERSELERH
jgi:hypothetical protein